MSKMVPIPAPQTLCEDCAKEFISLHPSTEEDTYVAAYCRHNQVGAVFLPAINQWRISCPISQERHQELIDNMNRRQAVFKQAN